jgi:hypothetical protein
VQQFRRIVLIVALGAGLPLTANVSEGEADTASLIEDAAGPLAEATVSEPTPDLVVRVRDGQGEAVRGASVWVRTDEGWIEGQSDARGHAGFDDLPAGEVRVQIVATGLNSSGGAIQLDGTGATVDFTLEPRRAPLTSVR